ncbi:MAG: hypothetical protein IKT00_10605 [Prevotella sp.]|nr:hypothetical protein [Prevotella sp.]
MKIPSILKRNWKPLLTLGFGVLVFLFWMLRYPFLLLGKEEVTLFLWDKEFLRERLAAPGGLAHYIGDFLTQFFYDIRLGALVFALLFVVQQWMVWRLCKRWEKKEHAEGHEQETKAAGVYLLSFIPSFILWFLTGDLNVEMTYIVAVVLASALMTIIPVNKKAGVIILVIAIPLTYWLLGPVAVILPFCVFLQCGHTCRSAIITFVALMLLAILCVVGSWWFAPYPLNQLVQGIHYCFWDSTSSAIGELLLLLAIVAIPFFCGKIGNKLGNKACWFVGVACFLLGLLLAPRGFHDSDYEEVEYDALLRCDLWQTIYAKGKTNIPGTMACRLTFGEALCRKGEASRSEMMKALTTNGVMNSQPSAFIMSELYFMNNMVNKSQYAAFEAMQSGFYSKSARALRRLVETNLITGHYKVALKYISLLEETLFYRSWAKKMRTLAEHPEHIDDHPTYGPLRLAYLQSEDELFY